VSDYRAYRRGNEEPHVLVVGTTAFDAKGQPDGALRAGQSVPGVVHLGIGGVGRNVAENLARFGIRTTLLSAIGDDAIGRYVLDHTARSGVDVSLVVHSPDRRTAAYVAVLDRKGMPAHAIDDMAVMDLVTPALVYRNRRLFRDASMVVVDANLSPRTLETVFNLARRYNRLVCLDPTSSVLAPRVRPYLSDVHLLVPNLHEAQILAGMEEAQEPDVHQLAIKLVGMGVRDHHVGRDGAVLCHLG